MPGPVSPEATRPLRRVPVPPGAAGPSALIPALAAALDGSGPAIAPIPTVTPQVSNDYVTALLRAVRAGPSDPPLESDDVAVVMATSGSTGAPRGVLLTADQLTSMTAVVNGPGARPQWIVALPVTSMGGLNVLVRALAADRVPIALSSIGGAEPFSPVAFHRAVTRAESVTDDVRVALVPAQLARLLTHDAGIEALQSCSAVLVGGGSTRRALLSTAGELGVAVTTTYGATETSGGCVFDGRPLPGVVVTSAGQEPARPGVLTISGPCIALGYRGETTLTADRFRAGGFLTTDLGVVASSGAVTVIGRADDVVVIKGINVSPHAVERVICDLPDVVAAAAVTLDDEVGEPRILVFVEAREDAPALQETIEAAVARTLGNAARPGGIRRVEHLPHLPNGKVDRLRLQEWARDGEQAD